MKNNMRILVTGALGHIGSALIRQLPLYFPGIEIIMVDNMMTQRYPSLFNLPSGGFYRFLDIDLRSEIIEKYINSKTYVVHLAAITDAAGTVNSADLLESNNFQSTEFITKICLNKGAKLITLSSTSVYGTQEALVDEKCPEADLKPQSPYAVTKLKEERLVKKMSLEEGLNVITFRFGTIFGASEGMRFHTAVNKFCWQATFSQPITVWKTAYNQKRPYLALEDAVNAICYFIDKNQFDGELYNIVTLNATVKEITDAILRYVPKINIEFVDSPIMNQLSYEVEATKAFNAGFKCSGNLSIGIGKTISLLRAANSINLAP
jgi:nucleoside-diphosphate-sugar epimerase